MMDRASDQQVITIAPRYSASIERRDRWWIGWVDEVAGVNSQGETREELIGNLGSALAEALEMR